MGVTLEGGVPLERPRTSPASGRSSALRDAGAAAWLALLPCAVITAAAVWFLGPWVGHRLIPAHRTFHFWAGMVPMPHPRELGRFVVALAGPMLLAGAIAAALRWQPRIPSTVVTVGVPAAQAALIATLAACLAGQWRPIWDRNYFTTATLVVAGAIAPALLLVGRSARLRGLLGAQAHEAPWLRVAAGTLATALTTIWMMHALNTDRSIGWSADVTPYHLAFHMDETFALLNGLTPLVTFTPQYGALWPYVVVLPLLAFGKTLLAYTVAMSAITSIALLAVFSVLRRVARNALAALLLFIPFLATTLFHVRGTLDARFTFGSYFAMWPMRYGGPFLLAWLVARHLSGASPRRIWPLFAAAGLVLLNNTEFGVPAVAATVAAVLWTSAGRRTSQWLALAVEASAGFAIAVALVSLLTLARAGDLPHFSQLFEFGRIYGLNGFSAIPIRAVRGLPTIIYLTYGAAIATATVCAVRGERDRTLTGMLMWTGVFGLGTAIYYVTRAHPDVLPSTFSPWALTLALLAIATFRGLATHPWRRQATVALMVFFGLGVTICSIAQFPPPWRELHRLHGTEAQREAEVEPLAPPVEAEVREFISGIADGPHHFVVRHGAPVAILATIGHRMADAYGLRDVVPYTGYDSISTVEQLERTLRALRDAGGNTLLVERTENAAFNRMLMHRGFEIVTAHGLRPWPSRSGEAPATVLYGKLSVLLAPDGLVKWVDTRHLYPRALTR